MDGNNLDSQKQPDDDISVLDKIIQNNPFVNKNDKYQNIQTKSVVESTREGLNGEYSALNARVAKQKNAEKAEKAKHTLIYVLITILIAAIIGVGAWIGISIYLSSQNPANPGQDSEQNDNNKTTSLGDYKCDNSDCVKLADTTIESTILIRDGKQYYLYDTSAKARILTTIPEEEYNGFLPFKWGEKDYIVLSSSASKKALFSLNDNRLITDFFYDSFYINIDSTEYSDMTWVEGKYIVAYAITSYRLIDINTGKELVQATKHVFAHDDFLFAYEGNSTIHVYSDDAKVLIVKSDEVLYTRGAHLVTVSKQFANVYNSDGTSSTDTELNQYIKSIKINQLETTLDNNSDFYRLPNQGKN